MVKKEALARDRCGFRCTFTREYHSIMGWDIGHDFVEPIEQAAEAICSPLCGASKAYGRFDSPWKHEPECPIRLAAEAADREADYQRFLYPKDKPAAVAPLEPIPTDWGVGPLTHPAAVAPLDVEALLFTISGCPTWEEARGIIAAAYAAARAAK